MIQPGIHCEISLIDISSTVCELTMWFCPCLLHSVWLFVCCIFN